MPKALILGLGNILLSDEGVGVRAVEEFSRKYALPEGVETLDGGTGGYALTPSLESATNVIVVDALRGGEKPGTIYRLTADDIPAKIKAKTSLHQVSFLEVLQTLKFRGFLPKVVIIGIEPKTTEMGFELSEEIKKKIPKLIELVLKELKALGVKYKEKKNA